MLNDYLSSNINQDKSYIINDISIPNLE